MFSPCLHLCHRCSSSGGERSPVARGERGFRRGRFWCRPRRGPPEPPHQSEERFLPSSSSIPLFFILHQQRVGFLPQMPAFQNRMSNIWHFLSHFRRLKTRPTRWDGESETFLSVRANVTVRRAALWMCPSVVLVKDASAESWRIWKQLMLKCKCSMERQKPRFRFRSYFTESESGDEIYISNL